METRWKPWATFLGAPLFIACVPDVTFPDRSRSLVELYDDAGRACAAVPEHQRDHDPFANVRWTDAQPIRVIEGKARLQRTAGVRLVAEETSARRLERRLRCRALAIASHRTDAHPSELLAVEDVEVDVRRRRGAVEVLLVSPTRSGGAALYERARALVENACPLQPEPDVPPGYETPARRLDPPSSLSRSAPPGRGSC